MGAWTPSDGDEGCQSSCMTNSQIGGYLGGGVIIGGAILFAPEVAAIAGTRYLGQSLFATEVVAAEVGIAAPGGTLTIGAAALTARTTAFRSGLIANEKITSPAEKAHHIVEIADKSPFAMQSRALLNRFGININDHVNGIGLVNHAGRHSNTYSKTVFDRLREARNAKDARVVLNKIGVELKSVDKSLSRGNKTGSGGKTVTGGWTNTQSKKSK